MPRFVADTVGVSPRIGEVETETGRMIFQPMKCGRPGEILIQCAICRRSDIDRSSGVVLAATRCGDQSQDVGDVLSGRQFPADKPGLPGHTAVAGDRPQFHAVVCGRCDHALPSGCGARGETHRFSIIRGGADRHQHACLALHRHAACPGVVGRDAEPGPE